jgi:hypothetical protein
MQPDSSADSLGEKNLKRSIISNSFQSDCKMLDYIMMNMYPFFFHILSTAGVVG